MRAIKSFLCWMYAIQAAVILLIGASVLMPGRHLHYAHGHPSVLGKAFFFAFFAAAAAVFGMAWWTVLKGKTSARYWIIIPCLCYILVAIGIVFSHPTHAARAILPLAMGVAGLVVTWRRSTLTMPAQEYVMPKIAGDGTSNLLNKSAQIFGGLAYLAALWACDSWMAHKGLPRANGGLLVLLLVGFLNTFVHECGHAVIGLALGMRLRAFIAGPFQWRIRDGIWHFQFKPAAILTDEGATGVVPTSVHQPRWHQIAMIAAGPATNLYCGLIALGFAWALSTPAYVDLGLTYPLALFGLFGLVSFFYNLIPLRSGTNYSDGAKIWQLLSDGPWADFHLAASVVSSSLVTPLQPKDYDIDAIHRASERINHGTPGLLLRLWAYSHFLDSGRTSEAIQALQDAERVFHDSAANIPAELHTVFVFANAYVRKDAAAARQWWDRMQTKKVTRLGVDHYRAESALHWIEGKLDQANIAWSRSNDFANKLPHAGAYQFDRTCNNLLRQAIDATPGGHIAVAPLLLDAQKQTYQWTFLRDIPSPHQPSSAVSE
jgi:hypothetical protein